MNCKNIVLKSLVSAGFFFAFFFFASDSYGQGVGNSNFFDEELLIFTDDDFAELIFDSDDSGRVRLSSFFNVDERNFMVVQIEEETSAPTFPFVLSSSAPNGAIQVRENGVGIGFPTVFDEAPNAPFHVYTDGDTGYETARIVVENASPATGFREMFSLINNGAARFTIENTANDVTWGFASDALGRFTFSEESSSGPEFLITPSGRVTMGPGATQTFDLRPNGNLFLTGTLSQSSDRNIKTAFEEVDPQEVLQKVSELPVDTWQFIFDAPSIRHIGPTAQDFHEAFGLGANDTTIAPVDGIGISLAAVKGLKEQVDEQQAIIRKLNRRLQELERIVGN